MVLRIIIIIGVVVLVLLFMPFYINIKLQRENENDKIEFKILLLKGLIKFGIDIPFIDIIISGRKPSVEVKDKLEEKEKDITENKHIITFKKMLTFMEKGLDFKLIFLAITRYLLDKIKVTKLVWKTSIGFENAAITGVLSGGLWSIKGSILSLILNYKDIDDLSINVTPHYNKNIFETYFDCIIRLKLVYIIIAGLNGLKVKLKGGEIDE